MICPHCHKEIDGEDLKKKVEELRKKVKLCLKDTNKKKEKGMPPEMNWRAEALGYKTCLCIINNIFGNEEDNQEVKDGSF